MGISLTSSYYPYPNPQSRMGMIIECLEAEPAQVEEIALYVGMGTNSKALLSVWNMLGVMRRGNLVRKDGEKRWALVDPCGVAKVYGGDEEELDFDDPSK